MQGRKIKTRSDVPEECKWGVNEVYKDTKSWESDFDILKDKSSELSLYNGKLGDSKELLKYFKLDEKLSRLAEKLYIYAHLRSDEDASNAEFQALKDKIDVFMAKLKGYSAFFVPEILSLGDKKIEKEINEEKDLELYRFYLKNILRQKAHFLSKEEEKIMASVSECLDAPGNIFGMLAYADMTFPVIKDENGNDVEITEANYMEFIRSKDRKVREEAFKALFSTYYKYRNTLSVSLTSSMKNFIFQSRIRKYNSSIEFSLEPNNISTKVFYNTIDTIDKNLDKLHRYVKLKKKYLGINEMHMYDLYAQLVDKPKDKIEFKDAVDIVKNALKPLGKEYVDLFQKGIDERWVDIYPNKGKKSGAYSWGCYDTKPYVLLNYNYELSDVSTLAHEMGHSIHSYYSKTNQPYIYNEYTLFCAEVASTTNENLLINYLINNEKDKNKKLFLVNQQLEQIRTTVFRQVMFAEFEKIAHETLEKGNALTSEDLCRIYHDLNVKYFGDDIIVDKEIDMEWARIPHFYRDFYVYQYATGYSAANSFANSIISNGSLAVSDYINKFLKAGGSKYPLDILKDAGVDMTTPKPIEDTMKTFSHLLDILDE